MGIKKHENIEYSKKKQSKMKKDHCRTGVLHNLNITNEADSLALWHSWAQAGKKHDLQITQEAITDWATSEHNYTPQLPVVSAQLYQDLTSFTFVGTISDMVKCGLHPFAITYESEDPQEAMIANLTAYTMISEAP
jgi:hypothetical protein